MKKSYLVKFNPHIMWEDGLLKEGWMNRIFECKVHDWIVKQCHSVAYPIIGNTSINYIFLDKMYVDLTMLTWNKYIISVDEQEFDHVLHMDYYNLDTEKHPDVEGSFF